MPRPHDATAPNTSYSGKNKRPMRQNILLILIHAAWRMLFLRETHRGRVHDQRSADTTPYPLPVGRQLRQDLGVQAFTRDGVEIIHPT